MYIRKRYRYPYKTCRGFYIAAWASLLVVLPAILKAPADKIDAFSKDLGWPVYFVQDHAWWLVPVLGTASFLSNHGCKWFQARYMNTAVWQLLQQIHRFAFQDIQQDPVCEHRVTLFRGTWCWSWANRSAWCWPFGHKLVIAVRSGHMTQKSKTTWSIGDRPSHCTGFAGLVWLHKKVICITNLPDVTSTTDDKILKQYAKKTNITFEWLKNKNPRPTATAYLGIPVEINNELWGVIVLDSSNPNGIRFDGNERQNAYDYIGVSVGNTLERSL